MHAEVWGLLGDIEFQMADAPDAFDHKHSIDLPEHDLIEGRPAVQYTGENLQTLKLDFTFHSDWCDPDERVKQLWFIMLQHKPQRLVLGKGTFKERWLISQISSKLTRTDHLGRTVTIACTIDLKEAGSGQKPPKKIGGKAVRKSGFAAFAKRSFGGLG